MHPISFKQTIAPIEKKRQMSYTATDQKPNFAGIPSTYCVEPSAFSVSACPDATAGKGELGSI